MPNPINNLLVRLNWASGVVLDGDRNTETHFGGVADKANISVRPTQNGITYARIDGQTGENQSITIDHKGQSGAATIIINNRTETYQLSEDQIKALDGMRKNITSDGVVDEGELGKLGNNIKTIAEAAQKPQAMAIIR